jgi:Protein of unknown function (DUF2793)
MADTLSTPRLSLPMLVAAQAQKEVTHNEALALIDCAIAPVAVAAGVNAPPVDPQNGACWLVGSAPTGAWTGQALALACWTVGGWRFVQLPVGAWVANAATGARWQRNTTGWTAPAGVAEPSGGAVVDAQSRSAITAILSALRTAGLIVTP